MGFASAQQPFPFNYVAYDGATGLIVAAKVYNMFNVLLATVPMPHVANGLYEGEFQGMSGQNYKVSTAVYTSLAYTTLDPNRSPGGDTFQCATVSGSGTQVIVQSNTNLQGLIQARQVQGQVFPIVNLQAKVVLTQNIATC